MHECFVAESYKASAGTGCNLSCCLLPLYIKPHKATHTLGPFYMSFISHFIVVSISCFFGAFEDKKNLTTISVELGFLWDFVCLSLKTCSLYHEKLIIQVGNDISSQVFNIFFSASDFMEAVRGCLCFYRYEKMQGCVIKVRLL